MNGRAMTTTVDARDVAGPIVADIVAALKRIRAAVEIVADIRDQQNLRDKTAPLRSDLQLRQDIVKLDASIAEMEGTRR